MQLIPNQPASRLTFTRAEFQEIVSNFDVRIIYKEFCIKDLNSNDNKIFLNRRFKAKIIVLTKKYLNSGKYVYSDTDNNNYLDHYCHNHYYCYDGKLTWRQFYVANKHKHGIFCCGYFNDFLNIYEKFPSTVICKFCKKIIITKEQILPVAAIRKLSGDVGINNYLQGLGFTIKD